jgi:hypothetical protein
VTRSPGEMVVENVAGPRRVRENISKLFSHHFPLARSVTTSTVPRGSS